MAYGLKKISPLDRQKSTALGVAIPFSSDGVFTSVYTTKEQTRYNIINFILTDRRERPFNPNFGAGLRSYLFEQIENNTLDDIQLSLSSKLESYFSNIKVTQLDFVGNVDNNSITIILSYTLLSTSDTDIVSINLQNR
jgi:phage baseplate assembly protein W